MYHYVTATNQPPPPPPPHPFIFRLTRSIYSFRRSHSPLHTRFPSSLVCLSLSLSSLFVFRSRSVVCICFFRSLALFVFWVSVCCFVVFPSVVERSISVCLSHHRSTSSSHLTASHHISSHHITHFHRLINSGKYRDFFSLSFRCSASYVARRVVLVRCRFLFS